MPGAAAIPHRLDEGALTCRAIIETPASSRGKFTYDSDSGLFELSGILPAGMAFPLDFGFIPSTRGEDGDPLDVLILTEFSAPLPVGCLVEVRLLGAICAEQTEPSEGGQSTTCRNDRIVARLAESRAFAEVDELDQLGDGFREEIQRFFVTYNDLKGYDFKVLDAIPARGAARLIRESCSTEPGARTVPA